MKPSNSSTRSPKNQTIRTSSAMDTHKLTTNTDFAYKEKSLYDFIKMTVGHQHSDFSPNDFKM